MLFLVKVVSQHACLAGRGVSTGGKRRPHVAVYFQGSLTTRLFSRSRCIDWW